jgi:hypothetical protein
MTTDFFIIAWWTCLADLGELFNNNFLISYLKKLKKKIASADHAHIIQRSSEVTYPNLPGRSNAIRSSRVLFGFKHCSHFSAVVGATAEINGVWDLRIRL